MVNILLVRQILILVDSLQNTIDLLLQQCFQLLDHELVNGTPLHEVRDQRFNSVALIHYDPLQAEIGHIDINVELRFPLIFIFNLLGLVNLLSLLNRLLVGSVQVGWDLDLLLNFRLILSGAVLP